MKYNLKSLLSSNFKTLKWRHSCKYTFCCSFLRHIFLTYTTIVFSERYIITERRLFFLPANYSLFYYKDEISVHWNDNGNDMQLAFLYFFFFQAWWWSDCVETCSSFHANKSVCFVTNSCARVCLSLILMIYETQRDVFLKTVSCLSAMFRISYYVCVMSCICFVLLRDRISWTLKSWHLFWRLIDNPALFLI
jgi:hypothetical protein